MFLLSHQKKKGCILRRYRIVSVGVNFEMKSSKLYKHKYDASN